MKKRALISSMIFLTIMVVGIALLFNYRQYLKDLLIVQTASQQDSALRLGSELFLTDKGTFLYKASQPTLQDASGFNQACKDVMREQTIVLGCYTMQRLHVFSVTDDRLDGVEQVTVAHELLHAVYERLSESERKRIDALTAAQAEKIDDPRFIETVTAYRKTNASVVPNELHSILGSEYPNLSPELEKHYAQYFRDRSKVVEYSQKYVAVFTEIENKQAALKSQLETLKSEISTLETAINSQQATLSSLRTQMDDARSKGNITVYNSLVGTYNARAVTYNADIGTYQAKIESHNSLVNEYNTLSGTQNDLMHEMDSQYQPTQ